MALFRSIGARPDATRGTTAEEVRKDLAGLVSAGVLPGGASPLVVGTDSMAYRVLGAVWATSRGAGDGVHLWGNDGAIDVSTSVAPGSGLSRIDVIYALHPSADENADTDSVPVVAVAEGTAASSPVAPSIPTGALELARNTMTSAATDTAGAGNTISQTAVRAQVGGGRFPSRRLFANMSIPDFTTTIMTWLTDDTGEQVPGLAYSSGELTVASDAAGMYSIAASVGSTWAGSTTGYLRVTIERNGASVGAGSAEKALAVNAGYVIASASAETYLAAGDKIRVRALQRSGAAMIAEQDYSKLTIQRVR